ncbi:MAG: nitroreductase family protein [Muribaculaceae bacterium]|nr:nitroreductase family protein [Muribaculaceae bacterium]
MKNSTYLILLLALGLIFTSYKWIVSSTGETASAVSSSSTYEDIMTRTSVRAYTPRPVEKTTVDTLLHAAMAAPTAANKQPWRFVVVDDRSLLDSISNNFKNMQMARNAALAIVLCGDTEVALPGDARDFWVQDVSAATENLLLAAHAAGLGAVWCGIYPVQERTDRFSKMLSLPVNILPMACVCVGYPDGTPVPKDKWHPEYIRYNSWNSQTP